MQSPSTSSSFDSVTSGSEVLLSSPFAADLLCRHPVSYDYTPTIADAVRAANALKATINPIEVLLFGSIARGVQTSGSDLDLVIVFDDLGDYARRYELKHEAKAIIARATGMFADVRITDRLEWLIRTKQCKSTFESSIASYAIKVFSRPPISPINWHKEIGMAPTDARQAVSSLNNSIRAFDSILRCLRESNAYATTAEGSFTVQPISADDLFDDVVDLEHSRILDICAYSQMAMETCLKALIHALQGKHPHRTHMIEDLVQHASKQLSTQDAAELEACVEQIVPENVSAWLEVSSYPDDFCFSGDSVRATPEYAHQMAQAAVTLAQTCITLITRVLGYQPEPAKKLLVRGHQIQTQLAP